jgi:hypothetical protein
MPNHQSISLQESPQSEVSQEEEKEELDKIFKKNKELILKLQAEVHKEVRF